MAFPKARRQIFENLSKETNEWLDGAFLPAHLGQWAGKYLGQIKTYSHIESIGEQVNMSDQGLEDEDGEIPGIVTSYNALEAELESLKRLEAGKSDRNFRMKNGLEGVKKWAQIILGRLPQVEAEESNNSFWTGDDTQADRPLEGPIQVNDAPDPWRSQAESMGSTRGTR